MTRRQATVLLVVLWAPGCDPGHNSQPCNTDQDCPEGQMCNSSGLCETGTRPDAGIDRGSDQKIPDRGSDEKIPDKKVVDTKSPDAPPRDQGADLSGPDGPVVTKPDLGQKDALQPDQGPQKVVLLQSGLGTVGPPAAGTPKLKLLESGFGMGPRLCNTSNNVCVISGGIAP